MRLIRLSKVSARRDGSCRGNYSSFALLTQRLLAEKDRLGFLCDDRAIRDRPALRLRRLVADWYIQKPTLQIWEFRNVLAPPFGRLVPQPFRSALGPIACKL